MELIYGSKLFKASNTDRKQRILAAMTNPVNQELVSQLKEQLDVDSLPLTQDDSKLTNDNNAAEPSKSQSSTKFRSSHPSASGSSAHLASNPISNSSDDSDEINDDTIDLNADNDTDDNVDDDNDDNVNSSTSVVNTNNSQRIVSSSEIPLAGLADELKGTLNLKSDTAGVNRILLKQNELWIYYDDSINLNNVMTPVIELLNSTNYFYLEFNRLARTDNAIVFEVSEVDSNQAVDPVKADELDDK